MEEYSESTNTSPKWAKAVEERLQFAFTVDFEQAFIHWEWSRQINDRPQLWLLSLSEFKRIKKFLSPLKLSESLWISVG